MPKNNNLCPYDILGSLACDMIYRDQELYRQMDVQLKSGAKNKYVFQCGFMRMRAQSGIVFAVYRTFDA